MKDYTRVLCNLSKEHVEGDQTDISVSLYLWLGLTERSGSPKWYAPMDMCILRPDFRYSI